MVVGMEEETEEVKEANSVAEMAEGMGVEDWVEVTEEETEEETVVETVVEEKEED